MASQKVIRIFYSVAMAMGALAALVIGKFLDQIGLRVLLLAFVLPAFSAPLVFLGGSTFALVGTMLCGIGLTVAGNLGGDGIPLRGALH